MGGECQAVGVFEGRGGEAGAVVHRRAGRGGKEGREDSKGRGGVLQQWGFLRGRVSQGEEQREWGVPLLREWKVRRRLGGRKVRWVRN